LARATGEDTPQCLCQREPSRRTHKANTEEAHRTQGVQDTTGLVVPQPEQQGQDPVPKSGEAALRHVFSLLAPQTPPHVPCAHTTTTQTAQRPFPTEILVTDEQRNPILCPVSPLPATTTSSSSQQKKNSKSAQASSCHSA
jgi:hypothetical protein